MKQALFICLILGLLSGCTYQKFELTSGQRPTIPSVQGTSHFFFWGIGQTHVIIPQNVCGNRKVLTTETNTSFWNGVATIVTFGIYSPLSYAVYCDVK